MFTGIVEGKGQVAAITGDPASQLTFTLDLGELTQDVKIGDSIAINGTCLTVTTLDGPKAQFDAITETLEKTNLGDLKTGDVVNVERSLKVGDRIDGHFVYGHVDGKGKVIEVLPEEGQTTFKIEITQGLARYMIPKGSVTLDGISLTVVDAQPTYFTVCIIPHTLQVTNLGTRKVGDAVNIETDMLGKWIERLLPGTPGT